MLLMELTDGHTTLKAIEYRPIKELSLLTCPGCKVFTSNDTCCSFSCLSVYLIGGCLLTFSCLSFS